MRPPSYRQRLFLEHDLGESSGSAVDAARRAGYSTPHLIGVNMLRKATFYASGRSSASLVFVASYYKRWIYDYFSFDSRWTHLLT